MKQTNKIMAGLAALGMASVVSGCAHTYSKSSTADRLDQRLEPTASFEEQRGDLERIYGQFDEYHIFPMTAGDLGVQLYLTDADHDNQWDFFVRVRTPECEPYRDISGGRATNTLHFIDYSSVGAAGVVDTIGYRDGCIAYDGSFTRDATQKEKT